MREWFLIIGSLMIAGVLAYGVWLWLRRRYERNIPDVDVHGMERLRSELSTGGARPVLSDAGYGEQHPEHKAGEAEGPARSQGVNLGKPVPVLMDPIDQDVARAVSEEEAGSADGEVSAAPAADASSPSSAPAPSRKQAAVDSGQAPGSQTAALDFESAPLFPGESISPPPRKRREASPQSAGAKALVMQGTEPVEDIIVINVLCRDEAFTSGSAVVEAIMEQGLRFGDMNIFHRPSPTDHRRIDFSLANALEPGTFDLGVEDWTTRGVTLFMRLPGPEDPLTAFGEMVKVARGIAAHLHADLRDEQRSVMTDQTLEHCRQRIRDSVRRQLYRRP